MNEQIKLDKGHLQIADRVLDKAYINDSQWQRDCEAAKGLGLVEWELTMDGYVPVPTQRYIDLLNSFG